MNNPVMDELVAIGAEVATAWTRAMQIANRYNMDAELSGILTQFNRLYVQIQEFASESVPDFDVDRDEPLMMDWDDR